MTEENHMIIERINCGIVITYDTIVEFYVNMTISKAESEFRKDYGLKGKKIKKTIV